MSRRTELEPGCPIEFLFLSMTRGNLLVTLFAEADVLKKAESRHAVAIRYYVREGILSPMRVRFKYYRIEVFFVGFLIAPTLIFLCVMFGCIGLAFLLSG